jgi:hypothetical protein
MAQKKIRAWNNMAGYPEYYKISYTSGQRVLTVCDNPKPPPIGILRKEKQKPKKTAKYYSVWLFGNN